LKNAHLRRFPYPSPLNVPQSTPRGLVISGALHMGIFEKPLKRVCVRRLATVTASAPKGVAPKGGSARVEGNIQQMKTLDFK
jgi:hypothetical protein